MGLFGKQIIFVMDFKMSWVLNTTPMYRIMSLKWFMVMIKEKCNTLVRPSLWEDPYETNYSNSVIATEKGDIPLCASKWFGQCWSLCEESAIMWQAFKKTDDPYVKIKVEPNDLIMGLKKQDNNLRIGILDYIRYFEPTINDYKEKLEDVITMHKWPDNFINRGISLAELYPLYNLLTKREVFKHEEEVRLLLFDNSSSEEQTSVSYSFDPTTIDEVVVDPWTSLDNNKFKQTVMELRLNLPSQTTEIRKSEIYCNSSKFATRYIK